MLGRACTHTSGWWHLAPRPPKPQPAPHTTPPPRRYWSPKPASSFPGNLQLAPFNQIAWITSAIWNVDAGGYIVAPSPPNWKACERAGLPLPRTVAALRR
jgi:hypothetical protein